MLGNFFIGSKFLYAPKIVHRLHQDHQIHIADGIIRIKLRHDHNPVNHQQSGVKNSVYQIKKYCQEIQFGEVTNIESKQPSKYSSQCNVM